jgi:mono/diheme cytochrome c family protein
MRFTPVVAAVAAIVAVSCTTPPSKPADTAPKQAPMPKPVSPTATTTAPEPLTPPFTLSTLQGVYTEEEAKAGSDIYKGQCASCHQIVSHTGPAFRQHWAGRPLSALYTLIQKTMPQNAPGSLDEYSYGVVLAYILKVNGMPAGKSPIMGDSVDLGKIRMDTVRTNH